MKLQNITVLTVLLMMCGCYPEKDKQEEAIRKAEEFVIDKDSLIDQVVR